MTDSNIVLPQADFRLNDRFTKLDGILPMSGIQALVRLPLDQMRRDRADGLNTGTFISGYRGSPLGGYDMQLSRQASLLESLNIKFLPGINEELGATAVWGSQQVNLFEGATVDGVCGIWYGKTPGVDRSTDAFRHGNAAGASEKGGVLVVAGDDHGCKSSSYPGQSEFAFVDMHMPILNPATVQEVLDYGHYGIAMSRFSGCWVALITLSENMDSAGLVDVSPDRLQITTPENYAFPEGGLNIRLGDDPLEQEERLWMHKRPAALEFCRANALNTVVWDTKDAKLGLVTTGKAHLDTMQALQEMGIDETRAQALGIRILKVGMSYPLDTASIVEFASGLDTLLVVEEKRSLMEVQLKEELYNILVREKSFPQILGKKDAHDNPLLPSYGELSPAIVKTVLQTLLPDGANAAADRQKTDLSRVGPITAKRTAYFCSGCPHNTSTKIPEGSRALAGIGCHYLVQNMDRNTHSFTQMGGEGVNWLGQAQFTDTKHVFVNLGDGTYFHSGILAIRAAIAAKANITYKILYNAAVAMTGGQPHDGELRPDMIADQVLAEGVERLVWVTDDLQKYAGQPGLTRGYELRHRDDMDAIQRELRDTKGVTCILYDQECATELRRKRKRGKVVDPARRVMINPLVCEGCGDCSVQSNCLSVEPLETEFGTKRQINQSTCNKDISCAKGFCPSFVTIEGGALKKPEIRAGLDYRALAGALDTPEKPSLDTPWNILVTGVGGTGVVTVGALLSTAAFIEGRAVTTLDQTGLAQKGGAVYSHIRLAETRDDLNAVRITDGSADALIACDVIAAGDQATCLSRLSPERSSAVINTHESPTASFVLNHVQDPAVSQISATIGLLSSDKTQLDAARYADLAFGNTAMMNIIMLGAAYQKGLVPLTVAAIERAMELNNVQVDNNKAAFALGRLIVADPDSLTAALSTEVETPPTDLDTMTERRAAFLTEYQNADYAQLYRDLVAAVRDREQTVAPDSESLSRAVIHGAFKLMTYKDEYEVARLHTEGSFEKQIRDSFSGDYKITYHMAPPLLSKTDSATGAPRKIKLGRWMIMVMRVLAKLKGLRGTAFDIFGYTEERRMERAVAKGYRQCIHQLLETLSAETLDDAIAFAKLPERVKGYGHVKAPELEKLYQTCTDMQAGLNRNGGE